MINQPSEFRLLSPASEIASVDAWDRILLLEETMLVGRDSRFSRSISDRSGLFGVSSSVNSTTGGEAGSIDCTPDCNCWGSFSTDVDKDVVYHWQFGGVESTAGSICVLSKKTKSATNYFTETHFSEYSKFTHFWFWSSFSRWFILRLRFGIRRWIWNQRRSFHLQAENIK